VDFTWKRGGTPRGDQPRYSHDSDRAEDAVANSLIALPLPLTIQKNRYSPNHGAGDPIDRVEPPASLEHRLRRPSTCFARSGRPLDFQAESRASGPRPCPGPRVEGSRTYPSLTTFTRPSNSTAFPVNQPASPPITIRTMTFMKPARLMTQAVWPRLFMVRGKTPTQCRPRSEAWREKAPGRLVALTCPRWVTLLLVSTAVCSRRTVRNPLQGTGPLPSPGRVYSSASLDCE